MPDGSSADAVFAELSPVVEGLTAMFARSCEVVLHNYRHRERSVVAVAGTVTGRAVEDTMSEIGLRVLAAGDDTRNEIGYVTRAQDGQLLKCTTLPLRDADGMLICALCVNIDLSAVHRATGVLADLLGLSVPEETAPPRRPTFRRPGPGARLRGRPGRTCPRAARERAGGARTGRRSSARWTRRGCSGCAAHRVRSRNVWGSPAQACTPTSPS
ncbi:hypothetical protein GCM10009836_44910 [Pseudonocardia ailaonensis]|uniref:YheO-like domain-containing protein n=1 Tax=Pseudonocardia ailaonensis TaxID=367279 RepID=A0ABN2NBD6_9PSEU